MQRETQTFMVKNLCVVLYKYVYKVEHIYINTLTHLRRNLYFLHKSSCSIEVTNYIFMTQLSVVPRILVFFYKFCQFLIFIKNNNSFSLKFSDTESFYDNRKLGKKLLERLCWHVVINCSQLSTESLGWYSGILNSTLGSALTRACISIIFFSWVTFKLYPRHERSTSGCYYFTSQ